MNTLPQVQSPAPPSTDLKLLTSLPTGIIPTLPERTILLFLELDSKPSCICFRSEADRTLWLSGSIIFGSICSAAISTLSLHSPGPALSCTPPNPTS